VLRPVWIDGDEYFGQKCETNRASNTEYKTRSAKPKDKSAQWFAMHDWSAL